MKKSLIIILFLSFFSCSSNHPEQLNQLPNWYVSPKVFNNQNLYGVGEGYTIAEASTSALNNLAAKLITSISSESSILLESNRYGINEQSRQNINESVAKITFNNYQISNSAAFGGKIYAEILVDRADFIRENQQKLGDLNHRMAESYQNLQSKTILEKYNDLSSINNLSLEASNINSILASLDAGVDFKSNVDLYNSYQNSYRNLVNKMEFVIETENTPAAAVKAIIKSLNKQNFKVVKNKNLSNSNLIIIQIESDITEQEIYGSNIAKVSLHFNLLSNQNKIIKSNLVEVSGSSVISKKEAINAAIINIAKKDLSEIFGLKN